MKTKKAIISWLFLLAGFYIQAQDVAIGARGGISIPNLSASGNEQNPLNTGYSSRLGPEFGVFAEFKISDFDPRPAQRRIIRKRLNLLEK